MELNRNIATFPFIEEIKTIGRNRMLKAIII